MYSEQIENYLNKNYYISDKKFFRKNDDKHEWGWEILKSLPTIFGFDAETCKEIFEAWGLKNGFSFLTFEEDWMLAMNPKKLKATWSPEMAQDLTSYSGIDAESELITILIEQISEEIQHTILTEMRREIKNIEDFLRVMKCLGYQSTPTVYNPETFTPYKGFFSVKYEEMLEERKKNHIWKKWESKKK